MNMNKRGLDLLEGFEGVKLVSYRCPAGKLSIGYGHSGPDVYPGEHIDMATAEDLLAHDVAKFSEGVAELIDGANENQFSAMVCLAYNIGLHNFLTSSVRRFHNRGDYAQAADAFRLFNKKRNPKTQTLEVCVGLIRRREAERALYLLPMNFEEESV